MLVIRDDLVADLVAHARRDHPREACGQLVGPEGSDRPERYVPMTNADDPRAQGSDYAFDSREQLRVYRECDEAGDETVVVFHSHTRVPRRPLTDTGLPEAYPSVKDIEYMGLQPGVHFVIIALTGPDAEPDLRSFLLSADGEVVEDEVQVVGASGTTGDEGRASGATGDEGRASGATGDEGRASGATGDEVERYMLAHTGADDVPDRG